MYAVEVRSHIMIAHSFKGELFGPAQRLHGATFVIDVALFRQELTADGRSLEEVFLELTGGETEESTGEEDE